VCTLRGRTALLTLLLTLTAACASSDAIPVSSTYDPLTRFPAEATFVWDDAASRLPSDPEIDGPAMAALIKDVATEAFGARGYRPASGATPDYRLSYDYEVNTRIGPDISKAVGSISLLLVQNSSGRKVWLGFGRAEIHVGLSPAERRARLLDAMNRMLEKFPPSQRDGN